MKNVRANIVQNSRSKIHFVYHITEAGSAELASSRRITADYASI
jgi:hypothetical protein